MKKVSAWDQVQTKTAAIRTVMIDTDGRKHIKWRESSSYTQSWTVCVPCQHHGNVAHRSNVCPKVSLCPTCNTKNHSPYYICLLLKNPLAVRPSAMEANIQTTPFLVIIMCMKLRLKIVVPQQIYCVFSDYCSYPQSLWFSRCESWWKTV